MSLQFELEGVRLDVSVVRRARKSIGLRLVDGRLDIVAPPRVSLAALQALLEARRDWIARHWRAQQETRALNAAWPSALPLLGASLPLLRDEAVSRRARVEDGVLRVGGDDAACRRQVADFLRDAAGPAFSERFARLAPLAARPPGKLALSSARTRWGSCTAAGVIRLNWRLIQAPVAVLDYVIAHELAHLRHMNHSPAFWDETARLFPAWRPARQWLKRQGGTLFCFG